MLNRKLDPGSLWRLETLLHHYAFGKPKETLEGTILHKVYAWQD